MPTGTPFKYAGSLNTATGEILGAGFDGLPIVSMSTLDVTSYDKYHALTAEQICSAYWNLAGVKTNLDISVPILSFTNSDGDTFTNTDDYDASLDEIFLQNNSSGQGFDPIDRMIAYPDGDFVSIVGSEASGDPLSFIGTINATMTSVSSIRRLEVNGSFIGYGMQICNLYVNLNNRSVVDREEFYKRVIVSSFFENEVDDSSDANLNVNYSQVSVGDGLFFKEEQEYGKSASDSYLTEDMITLSLFSPIFFDY